LDASRGASRVIFTLEHDVTEKKGKWPMSQEQLELWKTFFERGSVVLLLLTFLFGWGALRFSERLNVIKDGQLAKFNDDLTAAKTGLSVQEEKTANAELRLLKLQEHVRSRNFTKEQRTLLVSMFRAAGWKKVTIIWVGDGEPEFYARLIGQLFTEAGVTPDVRTMGPFIPSSWGLKVVKTPNDVAKRLKAIFDEANVKAVLADGNDDMKNVDYPFLVVGQREDLGTPDDIDTTEKN
jgi:hypothetical protein